ncbi:MAG: methyl-accepting chemotaxis protein [Oscillospiraceae bacterium]|nr:methyl-accepting chemotaxis protein [Oscillospiraceae bacterium]
MKNLKVSLKLIIGFMIVVVLAVVVGIIGIVGMNSINKADDDLYNFNVVALSAMGDIRETLQDQIVQVRSLALNAGNPTKLDGIKSVLDKLEREMLEFFEIYEGTITDATAEKTYFHAKETYLKDFAGIKSKVREASLISTEEAYNVIYDPSVVEVRNTLVAGFLEAMLQNDAWALESVNNNTKLFWTMLITSVIILVLTVVVAMSLAMYISSLIAKPLLPLAAFMSKAGTTGDIILDPADVEVIGKYAQVKDEIGRAISGAASFVEHVSNISAELELVAGGDLTIETKLLSENDVMGKSVKKMVENLNSMFSEIQNSTDQVSTGASQISDGAQALAQGTTEQAASIEQLSSSMAEISQRTIENAETANEASKLSAAIKVDAEKGISQMDGMINAVKEINDASHSIGNIIKTIDDIAFQTNILALNAAVEAARAGQHGKGFAVVAEEVRNLASKSAQAAKDTSDIIQDTIEKTELGSRLAGETATSLNEIANGISESNKLVSEIAISSEEQSQSISQINIGINQVTQVVQQNSATAQESAAASEQMSSQSNMLKQLTTQFKLKDEGDPKLYLNAIN